MIDLDEYKPYKRPLNSTDRLFIWFLIALTALIILSVTFSICIENAPPHARIHRLTAMFHIK